MDVHLDSLVLFELLPDLTEIGRDKGVHPLIGHTGGGVERGEKADHAGLISCLFDEFSASGGIGRLVRFLCAGGNFPQVTVVFGTDRESVVADHDDARLILTGIGGQYGKDTNGTWVTDDFAPYRHGIRMGKIDLLEIELSALVEQASFSDAWSIVGGHRDAFF